MKRIVLSWIRLRHCRAVRSLTHTSNETGQNRHELRESRMAGLSAVRRAKQSWRAGSKPPPLNSCPT